MKKRRVLYTIYCVAIVLILGIVIVLLNDRTDNPSGSDMPVSSAGEKIYANNLILNCSREITVSLDAVLSLGDDFVLIEPANCTEKLTYTVTNKSGVEISGISYSGHIFEFSQTGFYYIKYSIAGSETKTLTQTLVINAVRNNELLNITQLRSKLKFEGEYNFSDCFDITVPANASVNVETMPAVLELKSNIFLTKSIGSVNVKITVSVNQIDYIFSYTLTVEEKDEKLYSIILPEYSGDIIYMQYAENGIYKLQYTINCISDNIVDQRIVCVIDNDNAEIESAYAPFIIIRYNAVGSVELTMSSEAYENVYKTITIVFYV